MFAVSWCTAGFCGFEYLITVFCFVWVCVGFWGVLLFGFSC